MARRIIYANFGVNVAHAEDQDVHFVEFEDRDTATVHVFPVSGAGASVLAGKLTGHSIIVPPPPKVVPG
jgi:hypothetical protein